MKHLFLILSLILIKSTGATARQTWDLKQCIAHALENNVQVKQHEQQVEGQKITINSIRNQRLPGLDASVSQSFNFGRGLTSENTYVNRNTMSTSFGVNVSLPLYDGGQITQNLKMQKLQLAALMEDHSRAQEDLSLQVTSAYLEVNYQEELLKVAQQQHELSKAQEVRLHTLWQEGKASESEWADAKALAASDLLAVTQAEGTYQMALLELAQLIELPSLEGFSIAPPEVNQLEQMELPLPDAVMAEAMGLKPAIKAGELKVNTAQRNIKLARTGYFPKLSLGAGLGTNFYKTSGFDPVPFSRQMKDNFNRYVGLSLSIPIFDRLATRNQVRTARIQLHTQQLALEQTRKQMYKEIQQAYYNAKSAQQQCQSAQAAEQASQAAFALMSTKYENGQSTVTDYQEAKTRLAKAHSEGLRARYTFLFRYKILDFYRGIPL